MNNLRRIPDMHRQQYISNFNIADKGEFDLKERVERAKQRHSALNSITVYMAGSWVSSKKHT